MSVCIYNITAGRQTSAWTRRWTRLPCICFFCGHIQHIENMQNFVCWARNMNPRVRDWYFHALGTIRAFMQGYVHLHILTWHKLSDTHARTSHEISIRFVVKKKMAVNSIFTWVHQISKIQQSLILTWSLAGVWCAQRIPCARRVCLFSTVVCECLPMMNLEERHFRIYTSDK
jgi:hypothetical protein